MRWPASLTFDVDAEPAVLCYEPAAASRASLMSHQADGPLIGVPRLLSLPARPLSPPEPPPAGPQATEAW